MAFLGHIITSEVIDLYPKKNEEVKNWPTILIPTDIRSFLGIVRYYRRFFAGFASIGSPLTILTQNIVKF